MTTAMTKRLARAVLIAGLALPVTTLLPATAPLSITQAHAAGPTTVAEFKSVRQSIVWTGPTRRRTRWPTHGACDARS